MKRYLKTMALFLVVILTCVGFSIAQVNALNLDLTWTPPTHYAVGGVCSDQTVPIDNDALSNIIYVVSYKETSAVDWTTVEVTSPTYTIPNVPFGAQYEVSVVAKLPGGEPTCVSETASITAPSQPAPGTCTNIQGTFSY